MSKICIVSYYGSVDAIELAEKALMDIGNEVFDFPLFKFMHDVNDKVSNYTDKFIDYITTNKIDFVLWWFINIPTNEFIYIKNKTNTKYLFFNWDDPYNWESCDIVNKMPYFDAAFVTCEETLNIYNNNGCKHAYCLYAGYSEDLNYMITEINMADYNEYACDISICCTNLYEDDDIYPNQYINRKKIITDIYNEQSKYNYKFYIYGPEYLKNLFPLSYKGFIKYNDLNNIFNYSKINLCTHVLSNKDGYINERVFLIGGSGGLLLVDAVKGIENVFNVNEEIILLDKYYYINQIISILDRYDHYIKIRKTLNNTCKQKYTYKNWAKFIHTVINKL